MTELFAVLALLLVWLWAMLVVCHERGRLGRRDLTALGVAGAVSLGVLGESLLG